MTQPLIGISGNLQPYPEDSNLFQSYTANGYVEGIQKSGGLPLIIPIGKPELAKHYAVSIDKLILTGGQHVSPHFYGEKKTIISDDYSLIRDTFELALIQEMLTLEKPIFATCRGTQLFNVALGGTLYQDITDHWQNLSAIHPTHKITLTPNTPLSDIFGTNPSINSLHRQAIKDLAPGLEIIGLSAEDHIIEAVRSNNGYPFLGLQWHPEFMIDHREEDLKLFHYITHQL